MGYHFIIMYINTRANQLRHRLHYLGMNYSVWKNTVSICLLFKGGDGADSPAGASGEASAEQLAEGTESFLQ